MPYTSEQQQWLADMQRRNDLNNDLQGLLQEVETSPIAPDRKTWVRKHLK